jgi:hypothetical protein
MVVHNPKLAVDAVDTAQALDEFFEVRGNPKEYECVCGLEVDAFCHLVGEKHRCWAVRGVPATWAEVRLNCLSVLNSPEAIRPAAEDRLNCSFVALRLVADNEVRMVAPTRKRLSKDLKRIRAFCEKDYSVLLLLNV